MERKVVQLVYQGEVMGKPRMTQRDKWEQRDCVVRYRNFADELRTAFKRVTKFETAPLRLDWKAYLPFPKSWSNKKMLAMAGQPHRQKPDLDNITKAVYDSLFHDDSAIAHSQVSKFWDDGKGPRLEITITWE